jgi:hypothetical protein
MGGSLNVREWFRRKPNTPVPQTPPPPSLLPVEITPPAFPRFLELPETVQDLIWGQNFPFYRDFTGRRFEIRIRIQPQYVPHTWTEPWWYYPRAFVNYIRVNLVATLSPETRNTLRDQLTLQPISRRTCNEFLRVNK